MVFIRWKLFDEVTFNYVTVTCISNYALDCSCHSHTPRPVCHASIPECLSVSLAVLFLTQGMSGSNVLSQPYFPRARHARDVAQGTDGDGEWEAIASVIHCLLTEEICGEIF